MGIRLLSQKGVNPHVRPTAKPTLKSGATRHLVTRGSPYWQHVAGKLRHTCNRDRELAQLAKDTDRLDKAIYGTANLVCEPLWRTMRGVWTQQTLRVR